MYQASMRGTSTWKTITKKQYKLYGKSPWNRFWKIKETPKTEPLEDVVKETTTKK